MIRQRRWQYAGQRRMIGKGNSAWLGDDTDAPQLSLATKAVAPHSSLRIMYSRRTNPQADDGKLATTRRLPEKAPSCLAQSRDSKAGASEAGAGDNPGRRHDRSSCHEPRFPARCPGTRTFFSGLASLAPRRLV